MFRAVQALVTRFRWLAMALILGLLGLVVLGMCSERVRNPIYWGWIGHEVRHATNVPLDVARAGVPSLGSHALLGQEDQHGSSPAVASPIDTQAAGSSFLVFNAGFASNTRPPTDNKDNVFTQQGPAVVYRGYDGRFDIKAYVALSAHGGADHTVKIVKNGRSTGELTLAFIEIRNAPILQDVAVNYPPAGPRASSAAVTTTGPATLIALWWGDAASLQNTAAPESGFRIIDRFLDLPPNSAVQGAVAFRQVNAAGTYSVTWNQSPAQGAVLWLFAFQADGTATTAAADPTHRQDVPAIYSRSST